MEYMGESVVFVRITYTFRGHKAGVDCSPYFCEAMMAGLVRDGATDVHIEHYYNDDGVMIKEKDN